VQMAQPAFQQVGDRQVVFRQAVAHDDHPLRAAQRTLRLVSGP
jgi:hypothetical protein